MPEKLDKAAFEKLFINLYAPLCRYCCQFVRDTFLAEEIVQEKFLYLWEKKDSILIHKSYESFLYTVVKNRSIDYLRSCAAKHRYNNEGLTENVQDTADPLSSLIFKEFESQITQIIESLPEKCYIIFTLKRFGGLKNSEIAHKLKISEKTVLNQLTKAKKLVKDALLKNKHLLLFLLFFL